MIPSRRHGEQAFTIMEMMVVVAIVGLMMAAATLSFQNITRSRLRSAASRTASAMTFAFDRATMTGMTIRMTLDLEKGEVWLEGTKERVTIGKDGAKAVRQRGVKGQQSGGGASPLGALFGLGGGGGEGDEAEGDPFLQPGIDVQQLISDVEADEKPVQRAEPKFAPIKGMLTKKIKFHKKIRIDAVVTPRLVEPVEQGQAHIYFFPQGHSEPAIVHLANDDDEYYSVVLHPLTGQARVYPCLYRIPTEFGVSDEKRGRRELQDCASRGGL